MYTNNGSPRGIHSPPLERVLSRLEGVEETASGYKACCPAHEDRTPSLYISEAGDGKVLLKCHAGCDSADIVHAMGLEWPDLFPDEIDASWTPWDGTEVEAYTYTDARGEPLYQVVRFEMRDPSHPAYGEKKFLQRAYLPGHPDAGERGCPDGYVWGRKKHGVEAVLYRLPRVLAAIERGETVYVVEGEKDVEMLERLGLTATCNPGGASRGDNPGEKWPEHMTQVLAGADVVCIPDNDAAGRALMDAVSERLVRAGCTVRILTLPDLPPKADVTDWMQAHGGTARRLRDLVEATGPEPWTPVTAEELIKRCEETGGDDLIFDHVGLLAELPLDAYPPAKKRLKCATGINLNDLERAVQEARRELEEREEQDALERRRGQLESGSKPVVVITDRPSADVVDAICESLRAANDPPRLFRRDDEIVSTRSDEDGRWHIRAISEALFDDVAMRSATFVTEQYVPCDPSLRVVRRAKERVDLPPLRGLTQVPILRPDGSVVSEPGYDEETGLLYRLEAGAEPPPIPKEPTVEEVRAALRLLREAWIDHPFADAASRANTLALALTPIVRPLLDDANSPVGIIAATRAGSGKTLLAIILGIMATGTTPAMMSAPTREAEWRKQITAQLARGEPIIVIDDVSGTLDAPSLRRVTTTSLWSDRILGASRQVRLPANATWCATGNNLRPRGDMVRRCFLIRLDTQMVEPHLREEFTHSQPEWTREHRGELAAALLTLARAWVAAGRPEPDTPTLGSFERWCHVIGGILAVAGVDGFLGNLSELSGSVFAEDETWTPLLRAIYVWQHDVAEAEAFTTRRLATAIEREMSAPAPARNDQIMDVVDSLPDELQRRIRRGDPIAKALGRTFAYKNERRYRGGWYVQEVGNVREGIEWAVRRDRRLAANDNCDFATLETADARSGDPPPTPSSTGGGGQRAPEGPKPKSQSRRESSEAPF